MQRRSHPAGINKGHVINYYQRGDEREDALQSLNRQLTRRKCFVCVCVCVCVCVSACVYTCVKLISLPLQSEMLGVQ